MLIGTAETKSAAAGREPGSYRQILRSSSIIGGAEGITYLISILRVKAVAVLLGPSGVGLVGLYVSATTLIGNMTGLGIGSSGVREVAEAHGCHDATRVAKTVRTLRRACWVSGFLGWIITALVSYPLSVWAFDSPERTWAIAALGITLLMSSLSGGQSAILQGTRRIGDLAWMKVAGATVSTLVAVGFYAWLGQRGIVPVLIVTAAVNLGFSWWFARKIPIAPVRVGWTEAARNSRRLIQLGAAFMYGAVLASIVGLAIPALIVRNFGLEANGVYQAAWAISGMFASFILTAMGTDFYPRLTAVAHDNGQVNRLVNEQIEIGTLLALPGIVATLAFAPWVMQLFYSAEFIDSAKLLPWFALGVFGQVITFPIGFVQQAKGKARWMFLSQSHKNALHLILAVLMMKFYGIVAVAWAFALATFIHGLVVLGIARHLSNFTWSGPASQLALWSTGIVGIGIAAQSFTDGLLQLALGALITVSVGLISLRGISARVGADHRLVKLVLKMPAGRLACGL